jgi:hypothetical protein
VNAFRPKPTDCRHEPPYPDHFTVTFAWSAPEYVVHRPNICKEEYPHRIDECTEFSEGHRRASGFGMQTNKVRILIDGEPHSFEPGTYTIKQLGLSDVAEITLVEQPVRERVIGGNDSFEIRGGESFIVSQRNGEQRDNAAVDPAVENVPQRRPARA